MSTKPARLDADRTAEPLTSIVHHPHVGDCVGPAMPLHNPEHVAEDGTRTPLAGTTLPAPNNMGIDLFKPSEHPKLTMREIWIAQAAACNGIAARDEQIVAALLAIVKRHAGTDTPRIKVLLDVDALAMRLSRGCS